MHSNLAESRAAYDLGSRIVDCALVDSSRESKDPAAGVALLLSDRCAAAVIDSGHVGNRICWVRIDARPQPMRKVNGFNSGSKPTEPGDLRLACWNVTSYSWDAPR
jgi:hypothetical protein